MIFWISPAGREPIADFASLSFMSAYSTTAAFGVAIMPTLIVSLDDSIAFIIDS